MLQDAILFDVLCHCWMSNAPSSKPLPLQPGFDVLEPISNLPNYMYMHCDFFQLFFSYELHSNMF